MVEHEVSGHEGQKQPHSTTLMIIKGPLLDLVGILNLLGPKLIRVFESKMAIGLYLVCQNTPGTMAQY